MKPMNNEAMINKKTQAGTAAPFNFAPPPNFLEAHRSVKHTWLLCLFLTSIIAMPVQSQTAIPRLSATA